jgi:hypothetical protein
MNRIGLVWLTLLTLNVYAQDLEEKEKPTYYGYLYLSAERNYQIAFNYHYLHFDEFLSLTPYTSMYKTKDKYVYISSFAAPEVVEIGKNKLRDAVSEFNYANTQMQGFQSKYYHNDFNNPYNLNSPNAALGTSVINYLLYNIFSK